MIYGYLVLYRMNLRLIKRGIYILHVWHKGGKNWEVTKSLPSLDYLLLLVECKS